MHCPECYGDRLVATTTELAQTVRGEHRIFVGLPALKCTQCGHLVLTAATVELMENAVNRPPSGMMSIPVFDMTEKHSWRINTPTTIRGIGPASTSVPAHLSST